MKPIIKIREIARFKDLSEYVTGASDHDLEHLIIPEGIADEDLVQAFSGNFKRITVERLIKLNNSFEKFKEFLADKEADYGFY